MCTALSIDYPQCPPVEGIPRAQVTISVENIARVQQCLLSMNAAMQCMSCTYSSSQAVDGIWSLTWAAMQGPWLPM